MKSGLWSSALAAVLVACTTTPGVDDPDVFPTPPTSEVNVSTTQRYAGSPSDTGTSPGDLNAAVPAVEFALLSLGLQGSVTYDGDLGKVVAQVAGPTVYNNAELAELIITIIGDPDQPGAMSLTYSELRVRIRVDPSVDRPCTCGFR